jgi:hypothetical protein
MESKIFKPLSKFFNKFKMYKGKPTQLDIDLEKKKQEKERQRQEIFLNEVIKTEKLKK